MLQGRGGVRQEGMHGLIAFVTVRYIVLNVSIEEFPPNTCQLCPTSASPTDGRDFAALAKRPAARALPAALGGDASRRAGERTHLLDADRPDRASPPPPGPRLWLSSLRSRMSALLAASPRRRARRGGDWAGGGVDAHHCCPPSPPLRHWPLLARCIPQGPARRGCSALRGARHTPRERARVPGGVPARGRMAHCHSSLLVAQGLLPPASARLCSVHGRRRKWRAAEQWSRACKGRRASGGQRTAVGSQVGARGV